MNKKKNAKSKEFLLFIIENGENPKIWKYLKSIKPKWLRISGYWFPRGGIPIDIFYENKKAPSNLYIPDTGIKTYKGR